MGMIPNVIKESARGWQTVRIDDVLLQKRAVFLTEEVNAQTSIDLLKQFMYLEQEDSEKEIVFCINSPGGEVGAGLAVYDYLRLMKSPIRTVCIGTAASMGSILFLAGDKREMLPHSRIMIHDPAFSGGSYAGKKPNEIEEVLKDLRYTQETLCNLLAERTGQPLEVIYEKTKKDTYFNAEEAIEFGLATGIVTIPEALQPTEGGNE
mgnify:FL=1